MFATVAIGAFAQPARRRIQQQGSRSNANTIDNALREFHSQLPAPMEEDVVWRRDIYRELNLMDDANAGLYYPTRTRWVADEFILLHLQINDDGTSQWWN